MNNKSDKDNKDNNNAPMAAVTASTNGNVTQLARRTANRVEARNERTAAATARARTTARTTITTRVATATSHRSTTVDDTNLAQPYIPQSLGIMVVYYILGHAAFLPSTESREQSHHARANI